MKQILNFLEGVCPIAFGVKLIAFHKKNIIAVNYGVGSVSLGLCVQELDELP